MAKIKNIAILVMSVLLLFGVCGLTACNKGTTKDETIDSLQQQIAELKDDIDWQKDIINWQGDIIKSLQNENKKLKNEIEELENEIDALEDENFDALEDAKILKYYHEPTIDERFEDNEVIVILKSAYRRISEIGFEDFKIVEEVSEIIFISSQLKTVNREDGVKLSLKSLEPRQHHIIHLELATHDKEKVLAVIVELKKLDMVLVAEPNYIYDIDYDI